MSALRAALEDYLRIRRRLGFTMPQDGRLLEEFVEFLERAGAQTITTELALAWARIPVHAHPHTWRQRLTVARGFAQQASDGGDQGAQERPLGAMEEPRQPHRPSA